MNIKQGIVLFGALVLGTLGAREYTYKNARNEYINMLNNQVPEIRSLSEQGFYESAKQKASYIEASLEARKNERAMGRSSFGISDKDDAKLEKALEDAISTPSTNEIYTFTIPEYSKRKNN